MADETSIEDSLDTRQRLGYRRSFAPQDDSGREVTRGTVRTVKCKSKVEPIVL